MSAYTEQPDSGITTITTANTQLLAVLRELPDLPAKPSVSAVKKSGRTYYRLRYATGCAESEGQDDRETIYVGKLTEDELCLLLEEIEFLWPDGHLPERWAYHDGLRKQAKELRETASALADKCGVHFQGTRMIAGPQAQLSDEQSLENACKLLGVLYELDGVYMAMANDLRALGEDITSGLLAPTQAWLDRFRRRVESVCRQHRRNGHSLERLESMLMEAVEDHENRQ